MFDGLETKALEVHVRQEMLAYKLQASIRAAACMLIRQELGTTQGKTGTCRQ